MSAVDLESFNFLSSVYELVTWLVALGVIMEGCEIWVRRSSERKVKRFIGPLKHPIPEPEMPHWAHNIGDIGFLILVSALIIEPICHSKIEALTGRENRRLTTELTSTTEKAGEAIKQASEANERAAEANERAALVESNNLVLAANVKTLRADNDWLAAYSDRRKIFFWPDEIILGAIPGVRVVLVNEKDEDSKGLAKDLYTLFLMAGWEVIEHREVDGSRPAFTQGGVHVLGLLDCSNPLSKTFSEKASSLLVRQLSLGRIAARVDLWDKHVFLPYSFGRYQSTNEIMVIAGRKPGIDDTKQMQSSAKQEAFGLEMEALSEKLARAMENQDTNGVTALLLQIRSLRP